MKNSQLSNDQTVTLAENDSKAIFIRCIANICKGSVKNTIKRDVSISARVIFKDEIKVTAVSYLYSAPCISLTLCPRPWWLCISKTPDCLLFNNNMRSSRQDSQGGDDREQGKGDQTESVQNHGGKLPITFYSCGLLVITDLVCNHFNFFQNKTKFSGHSRGVAGGRADVLFTGRNVARHPGRKEGLSYVVLAATRAGRGQ